ncbi:MAG TPA: hypothetical protein ENI85_00615 [Deltaproteobacteria bacterium]|nr:hypothetical protein [Deltaproteobacteria bacterium]
MGCSTSPAGWAIAALVTIGLGCASSRIPQTIDETPAGRIDPLPAGTDRVVSSDGSFSIGIVGRAGKGPGSALGHEKAEFGLVLPDEDIGLVAYRYSGAQTSIDDVVHHRRTLVRSAGLLHFVSEERFFLSTGRYRAASLCAWEGDGRRASRYAYSLIADTPGGAVEILAWTRDARGRDALRAAVLRFRLEVE